MIPTSNVRAGIPGLIRNQIKLDTDLPTILQRLYKKKKLWPWCLLTDLARYLDQETVKWTYRSSSQAATCFTTSPIPTTQSWKVEATPLSALP